MEKEPNISGISANLAESIAQQENEFEKETQSLPLQGMRVAISVSTSEELERLGMSENHIADISVELARYLMVNGASMIYGGDLRQGGYTELFSELSWQYKFLADKVNRFINYFPFPNSKLVSVDVKAEFVAKQVTPIVIPPPAKLGAIEIDRAYDPANSVGDRFIFAECFADMRLIMAKESDARILVGGKQRNYLGFIPGIVEEAYQSIIAGKPLYIIGGFGGAARSLSLAVEGQHPAELTDDFHFDSAFLQEFKSYCSGRSTIKLDYDEIVNFFADYGMKSLCKYNGLTEEENHVLFESTNIHELVFLVIKGLQRLNGVK